MPPTHFPDPSQRGPITVDEALALLPTPEGKRSVAMFEHGTMQIKLYAPRGGDAQSPHARDEVYVVAKGTGWFRNGEQRHRFAPNDVLLVRAHVVHRFEEFSDDLAVWVFFYGSEGGELAAQA
jgi:mannose-6-phosphate isomerase-like protein (cupin superfamily)